MDKDNIKDRLTNLFSFGGADEEIPEPGSEDNPWIGPVDPKLGRPREGYSGSQLRTIRRAQQRREAAQQRVGQRAYDRQQKALQRGEALVRQRQRVLDGEIEVSPALYENIVREAERLVAAPTEDEIKANRARKERFRLDALADRREARFRAGKPRGKDKREDTYNEYESFLPTSVNNRSKEV